MGEPRITTCGRLFIVHHPEVPSAESAREEIRRFREFSPDEPAPLLMIIDKVFPPMGNDVRAVYRKAVDAEPGVEAMAALVDGVVGMGASLVLSVITNIFGGRSKLPLKMFRDADDAARWLCDEAKVRVSAEEIVAAIDGLRSGRAKT